MNRVFAFMGVIALSMSAVAQAQDYDDIYGDVSSSSKKVVVKTKKNNGVTVVRRTAGVSTVETLSGTPVATSSISDNSTWDVDSYNRRGADYDTDLTSIVDTVEDNSMFANTARIERFYNPDVVIKSDDDELLELYFDNNTDVNLIVGTTTYVPTWGYSSWYSWYDPYYSWYAPYYSPWGWRASYWDWGWGPGYWGYSWGWHRPWGWYSSWGWGHHHYGGMWGHNGWSRPGHAGWDRPGHNSFHAGLGTMSRRPTSRMGGNNFGNNRMGSNGRIGTRNNGTRVGTGGMSNGRTRPSTGGGMMSGARRAQGHVGNVGGMSNGRVARDITTRNNSVSRTPSRSYDSSGASRSYGGSRSSGMSSGSRSYSGGSSSHSSGSYSGGGGRSSGGGGGHSGGGGGGGRRH